MACRSPLRLPVLAAFSVGLFAATARGEDSADRLAAWLDAELATLWKSAGYEPETIDDATFLRRTHLDLVGTIPSVAEARDFLQDPAADKRSKLVATLLDDRRSAEHFARTWRRTLAPTTATAQGMTPQLEPWLAARFAENTRFDDLAKRLVTGSYDGDQGAAAAFRQASGAGAAEMADATGRAFLGVRIGCARCHDHPFTSWKQSDFWGTAAFFANGIGTDAPQAITAENGKTYKTRVLGRQDETAIPNGRPAQEVFADWMTADANPYFAATAVNRTWQQLVGRGLVTPVEDLDLAGAEERAALLDKLAAKFAESGYDLRTLVAAICKSRAYQAGGTPADAAAVAARPLKTLAPEQVFDSLEQALMLPIAKADKAARFNGERDAFVARLDEAAGRSPEDFNAGVPQALMMMNGRLTAAAVDLDGSRTLRAVVDAPFLDPRQKVETLFLAALTREPAADEVDVMLKYVTARSEGRDRDRAYAEVFWALLNSPEFVLSR